MRNRLIAAAALALALPAAASAQPVPAEEDIRESLPDAGRVAAMGEALDRVLAALLDVEIGPLVEAVDPGRRLDPEERDRTLGEVAERDDPHFRERMRGRVGAATGGMGAMMEEMAVLTPVLRRSVEDMRRRIEESEREHRRQD